MTDPKKPPENKKSFAESLLSKKTDGTDAADDDPQKGFTKEWQHAAQAFSLRLWFKDGHHSEGLPWTLYSGDDWHSGVSDKPERLTLTFGTRVVTVEGYNLRRLVEQIDEGHLKSIREHDSKEVALIRSEKPADPTEIKAAIVRIEVEPPFEEFAKTIKEGEK
jgi:hypothetical protein